MFVTILTSAPRPTIGWGGSAAPSHSPCPTFLEYRTRPGPRRFQVDQVHHADLRMHPEGAAPRSFQPRNSMLSVKESLEKVEEKECHASDCANVGWETIAGWFSAAAENRYHFKLHIHSPGQEITDAFKLADRRDVPEQAATSHEVWDLKVLPPAGIYHFQVSGESYTVGRRTGQRRIELCGSAYGPHRLNRCAELTLLRKRPTNAPSTGAGMYWNVLSEADMVLRPAVEIIARQDWLDPVAEKLRSVAMTLYDAAGLRVADLLYGTWLGHPLHPVLTDVAIGGWISALGLDLLEAKNGSREFAAGADAAVALGLVGAVGSAMTGLNDWRWTTDLERPRRIGVGHAAMNSTATMLYLTSLLLRRKGARRMGRYTGIAGFGVLMFGAYLGGDLVYGQRIGVDHAVVESPPTGFVPVLPDEQLPEKKPTLANAGDVPVLLVRYEGQIHALLDTCSHLECSLAGGQLQQRSIVCPCHGSRFSLDDGGLLNGPATYPLPQFETRVREGQIEVRVST